MTLFSILFVCMIYLVIGLILSYADFKFGDNNEKLEAFTEIYALPLLMIVLPIYFIVKNIGVLVGFNKHKRDYFTIHELTAKNKTTLKEMGFEYGEFISVNNINYKGYRYNKGRIVVLLNGRVNHVFNLSDEEKIIIELIKNLPDKEEYI